MTRSAVFCQHANEVPTGPCPCDKECYCKEHTCRGRVSVTDVPVLQRQLSDQEVWAGAFNAAIAGGKCNGTEAVGWAERALKEFRKKFG